MSEPLIHGVPASKAAPIVAPKPFVGSGYVEIFADGAPPLEIAVEELCTLDQAKALAGTLSGVYATTCSVESMAQGEIVISAQTALGLGFWGISIPPLGPGLTNAGKLLTQQAEMIVPVGGSGAWEAGPGGPIFVVKAAPPPPPPPAPLPDPLFSGGVFNDPSKAPTPLPKTAQELLNDRLSAFLKAEGF
jgi:hypothetical protein